jgi:hypothetical protein
VTIGAIMLSVMLGRAIRGHFDAEHHFAFEAAAWYWHFVDVVWLLLSCWSTGWPERRSVDRGKAARTPVRLFDTPDDDPHAHCVRCPRRGSKPPLGRPCGRLETSGRDPPHPIRNDEKRDQHHRQGHAHGERDEYTIAVPAVAVQEEPGRDEAVTTATVRR